MNPLDSGFNERMLKWSGVTLAEGTDVSDEDFLILFRNERNQLDLVRKSTDLFSANILQDRAPSACAVDSASIIETVAEQAF